MNKQEQLVELFKRYLANNCTKEEIAILLEYFGDTANFNNLASLIRQELETTEERSHFEDLQLIESTWEKIRRVLPSYQLNAPIKLKWYQQRWVQIAAIILLIVFISGVKLFIATPPPVEIASSKPDTDSFAQLLPGTEKAILTLSDGSKLILNDSSSGILATQGNAKIIKKQDGQILYSTAGLSSERKIFNTMQTPRGGQYRLILPDGTRVWLNAESSIRYPVEFDKKERRVEVNGEVFFEVAHNMSHPFIVDAGVSSVRVMGTSFNINSYTDEPYQVTTLLEGSVIIENKQHKTRLKPGQQALIIGNEKIAVQSAKDIDEILAWKNGQFLFNSQEVRSIMRQISRWYDVDIEYVGKGTKETFSGLVSRTSKIDQVLQILQAGGIEFKLEGKKLIVMQ